MLMNYYWCSLVVRDTSSPSSSSSSNLLPLLALLALLIVPVIAILIRCQRKRTFEKTNEYQLTVSAAYQPSPQLPPQKKVEENEYTVIDRVYQMGSSSADSGIYLDHKTPTEVSGIARQTVPENPDHGVYLRTKGHTTSEPVSGRTQLVHVRLPDSGSVFDGQSQLTTLEERTWVDNDVNLDENEDDSTITSHETGIYMRTNYDSTESSDNGEHVDQRHPNQNHAAMDERQHGDSDRSGTNAVVKSTEC